MDAPPGVGRYSGHDDWCQVDATFEALDPWIEPSSPEAWRVSGLFCCHGIWQPESHAQLQKYKPRNLGLLAPLCTALFS